MEDNNGGSDVNVNKRENNPDINNYKTKPNYNKEIQFFIRTGLIIVIMVIGFSFLDTKNARRYETLKEEIKQIKTKKVVSLDKEALQEEIETILNEEKELGTTNSNEKDNENTSTFKKTKEDTLTLGEKYHMGNDLYITVKNVEVKDGSDVRDGEPYLEILYDFENQNEDPKSADTSISFYGFQGGVEVDMFSRRYLNSKKNEQKYKAQKKIQQGVVMKDILDNIRLTDTKTPIELILKQWGFSDSSYTRKMFIEP